ncbi:hypothetical protein CBER1_04724 [Cercospora berteroae]|uniref:GH16 domain-containing protein n=1 Tax=Cercospora berteroae TaxID=357750 RepID=A0A2S6BR54_9PEZI|nr:hypothetical protein CBER1_04724 [Cercospora berteroae]
MMLQLQDCDCGLIDAKDPTGSIFTSLLAIDFTKASGKQLKDLIVVATYDVDQPGAPYVRAFSTDQIQFTTLGLELTAAPALAHGNQVPCGQIFTRKSSYFYGSYSARIQTGGVPGTVAALYNYHNATSEVDVEYVSSSTTPTLLYTVKPQLYLPTANPDNRTYQRGTWNGTSESFQSGFHTWSFIWLPEIVHFGIDKNYTNNITVNVPRSPGHLAINHWSNGDPRYSSGPPIVNSTIVVSYLQAIYNDTDATPLACRKMQVPCVVDDGYILSPANSSSTSTQTSHLVSTQGPTSTSPTNGGVAPSQPAVAIVNSAGPVVHHPIYSLLLLCSLLFASRYCLKSRC